MKYEKLIQDYLAGPEILRRSINGMSEEQINAAPVQFKWSTRQVVCHIADIELIYAHRMKRVIAESKPTLSNGDPILLAARLAYDMRDVDEEIRMVKAIRRHMARILRSLSTDDFKRTGVHLEYGSFTLADLLQGATDHIPHHGHCIEEKRRALRIDERSIPLHLASVGMR